MKLARIYNDINEFEKELIFIKKINKKIITTSGGYDCLHIGHLRCIQESAMMAKPNGVLIIIVNGDGFLTRKKGKPFMNHAERMEIIAGLKGVDYVVGWDDGSQTVVGALEFLKPNIFTKGGDRSSSDVVPEFDFCQKIGCHIQYGVGGVDKVQSSSILLKNL